MAGKQQTKNGRTAPPRVQAPRKVQHPKRRAGSTGPGRGRSPLLLLGAAIAAALALVGGLVVANRLGGDDDGARPAALEGAATQQLLVGIPQDGVALGSPDAPVTLVEYADIQCPFCARWSRDVFPTIVRDYVRTGDVRLVFHGLAFLGPESDLALRATLAAGEQNRLWNVLHLLMENQGGENSGWVTEDSLREVGESVPGLDAERMLDERSSAAVTSAMRAAERAGREAGVTGTPSFEIGRTGGELRRLEVESLEPESFTAQLDAELGR